MSRSFLFIARRDVRHRETVLVRHAEGTFSALRAGFRLFYDTDERSERKNSLLLRPQTGQYR